MNPRTVRAWESGREPIPERVRVEVARIEARTEEAVAHLVAALGEQVQPTVEAYRGDGDMPTDRPDLAAVGVRW